MVYLNLNISIIWLHFSGLKPQLYLRHCQIGLKNQESTICYLLKINTITQSGQQRENMGGEWGDPIEL